MFTVYSVCGKGSVYTKLDYICGVQNADVCLKIIHFFKSLFFLNPISFETSKENLFNVMHWSESADFHTRSHKLRLR